MIWSCIDSQLRYKDICNSNSDILMKVFGYLLLLGLLACKSFSQPIYSVNVVGYHTRAIASGGVCTISNPLNGTNNHLNTVLRLPDWADGTALWMWDRNTQQWADSVQFYAGFGWFSPTDPYPILNPEQGAFISVPHNSSNAHLRIEFVGEVPSGALCAQLEGNNRLSLWGPRFCQSLASIKPVDGDTLFDRQCPSTSPYREAFNYFAGFGWFSANPDDRGPEGPLIPPGEAVWLQLPGPPRNTCPGPCFTCASSERTSAEAVRLTNPIRNGITFSFQINTQSNVTYEVQFAAVPCNPTWTNLATLIGDGETMTFTDTNAVALTKFYRVAATP